MQYNRITGRRILTTTKQSNPTIKKVNILTENIWKKKDNLVTRFPRRLRCRPQSCVCTRKSRRRHSRGPSRWTRCRTRCRSLLLEIGVGPMEAIKRRSTSNDTSKWYFKLRWDQVIKIQASRLFKIILTTVEISEV